jgi:AraC-like DNA-binding protein
MREPVPRRMYLPNSDRPFWHSTGNSTDHDLLYLGWGERQFGETPCPITCHEGWMYLVVLDGSPLLVTETARRLIKKASVVIVGPDHPFGWDDVGARVCRVLVWIWRSPVIPLMPSNNPSALKIAALTDSVLLRLENLHMLCREEVRAADQVMPVALSGLQRLVETTFLRASEAHSDEEQSSQRVNLATRWMESHLACRQPAVRIADYLGISPSTLHRLFKLEVGHSPDVHFQRLKMTVGKKRLEEGSPVKRVAYELGYRHPGDFTRAYTRFFGHAPGSERGEIATSAAGARPW